MDKTRVKVGELNFELTIPEDLEDMPSFEIENDASMVFENVNVNKARELKILLEEFIKQVAIVTDQGSYPEHESHL